jgi:hypothetical protein
MTIIMMSVMDAMKYNYDSDNLGSESSEIPELMVRVSSTTGNEQM